jgi:hypothetical protein
VRTRRAILALTSVVLVALVAAPQATPRPGAKKQTMRYFRIKMSFDQTREWTRFYEQRSGCTMTQRGNGLDVVKLTGTGSVNLPVRRGRVVTGLYPAGMTLSGTWKRSGQSTTDRAGPDCGPDGPTTETAPTDGCGMVPVTLQYATLEVNNRYARLTWDSGKSPDFKGSCPYYDGANDVGEGQPHLPGSQFLRMSIRFPHAPLRDPKRIVASGTAKDAATETCATLAEPCDASVSYDATAKVESTAKITLVRAKIKR